MDFIKDRSGRHLIYLNTLVQVPDYVKQATIDSDEIDTLPSHCFANEVSREFPIDNPGHIYLSRAYVLSAGTASAEVQSAIKSAASKFPEMNKDLEGLEAAFQQLVKAASDNRAYAVYVDFGIAKDSVSPSGIKGFYPIDDLVATKSSAAKLCNERERIPLELFVDGCRNIVKAASNFGCLKEMPAKVLEYGLQRVPDMEFVKQQAAKRFTQTNDQFYNDLVDSMSADPAREADDWVGLWLDADAQNGVKYAKTTFDPYQILHSGETKQAMEAELDQWTMIHGAAVPVGALKAVATSSWDAAFPKAASEKIQQLLGSSDNGVVLTQGFADMDAAVQKAVLRVVSR